MVTLVFLSGNITKKKIKNLIPSNFLFITIMNGKMTVLSYKRQVFFSGHGVNVKTF